VRSHLKEEASVLEAVLMLEKFLQVVDLAAIGHASQQVFSQQGAKLHFNGHTSTGCGSIGIMRLQG
jgi:hypothetical protein